MDSLTDTAMRQITKKYGHPDLMTTEFINVEGLHFAPERFTKALAFAPAESPLLAQIYGLTPQYFYQATTLICSLGFAGVDLNFGCPAKSVVHSGAGASMIKNPTLAEKIYRATRQATLDFASAHHTPPLPVSIKTRLGYDQPTPEIWFPFLLKLQPDLITIHARTLRQGYTGQADWSALSFAVNLRNQLSPTTAIFGNGDLNSRALALKRAQTTGVDGVTIGRSALGNPWVFTDLSPTNEFKLQVALEHAQLYQKLNSHHPRYSFAPMRTHLAAYVKHFPHAATLRRQLVTSNSSQSVALIIQQNGIIKT
jgi:tRNA-dihydrouridine synthase